MNYSSPQSSQSMSECLGLILYLGPCWPLPSEESQRPMPCPCQLMQCQCKNTNEKKCKVCMPGETITLPSLSHP